VKKYPEGKGFIRCPQFFAGKLEPLSGICIEVFKPKRVKTPLQGDRTMFGSHTMNTVVIYQKDIADKQAGTVIGSKGKTVNVTLVDLEITLEDNGKMVSVIGKGDVQ
jgi:hypothetical protein